MVVIGYIFFTILCLLALFYGLYKMGPIGWLILFFIIGVLFVGWYSSSGRLPAEKYGYGGEEGRQKILKEWPDVDPASIPDDAKAQRDMMLRLYDEHAKQLERESEEYNQRELEKMLGPSSMKSNLSLEEFSDLTQRIYRRRKRWQTS